MADISLADAIKFLPEKELSNHAQEVLEFTLKNIDHFYSSKNKRSFFDSPVYSPFAVYSQVDLRNGKTYTQLLEVSQIQKKLNLGSNCCFAQDSAWDKLKTVFDYTWERACEGDDYLFIHLYEITEMDGKRNYSYQADDFDNVWEDLVLFAQECHNAEEKAQRFAKVKRQNKELEFESKLEAFLQVNEIQVERQVSSAGKRLDLWIPGQLMIECKAGRVTGDDVCQAVDYLATFQRDVLLVGTGMSSAASRGIEAVNKISKEAKVLFVTQEACFGYLKAVCK